jgi:hypothetical protein
METAVPCDGCHKKVVEIRPRKLLLGRTRSHKSSSVVSTPTRYSPIYIEPRNRKVINGGNTLAASERVGLLVEAKVRISRNSIDGRHLTIGASGFKSFLK